MFGKKTVFYALASALLLLAIQPATALAQKKIFIYSSTSSYVSPGDAALKPLIEGWFGSQVVVTLDQTSNKYNAITADNPTFAAELNAYDLVIIGRACSNSNVSASAAAATFWNGLTCSIFQFSGYSVRSDNSTGRWQWLEGTFGTSPTVGTETVEVVDPADPTWTGISGLTAGSKVQIMNTGMGMYCRTPDNDAFAATNSGHLIAKRTADDPAGGAYPGDPIFARWGTSASVFWTDAANATLPASLFHPAGPRGFFGIVDDVTGGSNYHGDYTLNFTDNGKLVLKNFIWSLLSTSPSPTPTPAPTATPRPVNPVRNFSQYH